MLFRWGLCRARGDFRLTLGRQGFHCGTRAVQQLPDESNPPTVGANRMIIQRPRGGRSSEQPLHSRESFGMRHSGRRAGLKAGRESDWTRGRRGRLRQREMKGTKSVVHTRGGGERLA
jgi:hypothetical protein